MSLVCGECEIDIQPSVTLPGREGTMVHPNVPSLVWLPESPEKATLAYIEAPNSRSLCFECIERHVPRGQRAMLKAIYDCYEAETLYEAKDDSQTGRWVTGEESREVSKAWEEFKEKKNLIPKDSCIYCTNIIQKDLNPHFTARVMDRVYSGKKLSTWQSYQWSNYKEGMTEFKFCSDCFRESFSQSFKQLSYDLRGIRNPDARVREPEFYISPELFPEFMKYLGRNN